MKFLITLVMMVVISSNSYAAITARVDRVIVKEAFKEASAIDMGYRIQTMDSIIKQPRIDIYIVFEDNSGKRTHIAVMILPLRHEEHKDSLIII